MMRTIILNEPIQARFTEKDWKALAAAANRAGSPPLGVHSDTFRRALQCVQRPQEPATPAQVCARAPTLTDAERRAARALGISDELAIRAQQKEQPERQQTEKSEPPRRRKPGTLVYEGAELTPEEKRIAALLGVSEEQAKRARSK